MKKNKTNKKTGHTFLFLRVSSTLIIIALAAIEIYFTQFVIRGFLAPKFVQEEGLFSFFSLIGRITYVYSSILLLLSFGTVPFILKPNRDKLTLLIISSIGLFLFLLIPTIIFTISPIKTVQQLIPVAALLFVGLVIGYALKIRKNF